MTAEVVKYFFPKLVDRHNYTSAHSTQQKLSNWNMLNRKVLSKFNFHVPEESVKKIVSSVPGSIELVLCTLRERIEDKREGQAAEERQEMEFYRTTNGYTQVPTVMTQSKSAPGQKKGEQTCFQPIRPEPVRVEGSQLDPTFRLLLEEKDQALLALQETVEILQIKVNRLEHLVQLKDVRIGDLTRHVERYKAKAYTQ